MINEAFDLSFGVEFEAILAFSELLLLDHLPKEYKDLPENHEKYPIQKTIPESSRKAMKQTARYYGGDRSKYTGWGLTFHTSYGDHEEQKRFDKELDEYHCRGYGDEPMSIAKSLFSKTVRMYGRANPEVDDYTTWYLAQENSLIGVSKSFLEKHFERIGRSKTEPQLEKWDSHPIELVSRPLRFRDDSFREISKYLLELTESSDDRVTALITDYCGMHVHVGLRDNGHFDLATLQHLAYILVQYQPRIHDMFPESRCPTGIAAKHDLLSNMGEFLSEGSPPRSDDSDNSSAPTCPTIPFGEVRAKIFPRGNKPMTVPDLAELMEGGRNKSHVINWNNIYKAAIMSNNPRLLRTIEFRQHEGTLDSDATKWWVHFVVGLVRLAEHQAKNYGTGWIIGGDGQPKNVGYDGTGYPWTEWNEQLNVRDLFKMMDMDQEGRDHFEKRLQQYTKK